MLDGIFGPEYFQHGRLVVTCARDLAGCMKVAHKLMAKVNENFGGVVEVVTEHLKHEWWVKLTETSNSAGLAPGGEVPEYQVTDIPDGIREPPYARPQMPTLEFLFLWEDSTGRTRGHILYTMAHPEVPTVEQVDDIFSKIQVYFDKRWVFVELKLGKPVKGEFEEPLEEEPEAALASSLVGADVAVTVLALHPYGSARDTRNGATAHVTQCAPLSFSTVTDNAGVAKICFLPADINKVQVAETSRFHSCEVQLPRTEVADLHERPTSISITLTPKAIAAVTVYVFAKPSKLPQGDEDSGLIDWSTEEREGLPDALVEITDESKDGAVPIQLQHAGSGRYIVDSEGLPEGFVALTICCAGYKPEDRAVMLLVGSNDFYIPLDREA